MLGSFTDNRFTEFGATRFLPGQTPAIESLEIAGDSKSLRRELRKRCPRSPGIYGMIDPDGMLIYVGKSKSLLSRLITYLQAGDAAVKSQQIIGRAVRLVWEVWPHEFAALARELELIVRWRPRFNVQGQPGRARRGWLCVGRSPAPRIFLAPRPAAGARLTVGPLPIGGRVRNAVRLINDYFGLRDCPDYVPMHFVDQHSLFPLELSPGCLRAELGTCIGPCAALCTRHEYAQQVRQAAAFLQGTDRALLAELEEEMLVAARDCRFERAAQVRDEWTELSWFVEILDRLEEVRRTYNFVYRIEQSGRQAIWYLVRQGQIVAVTREPRSPRGANRALALLEHDRNDHLRNDANDPLNLSLLTSAWFSRNPQELSRTMSWQSATDHCRQLAAATGRLRATG